MFEWIRLQYKKKMTKAAHDKVVITLQKREVGLLQG